LATVVKQLAERIIKEAPTDRAMKLLTDAYLLTGLRVQRKVANKIFRGVRAMQESDTYLAILDEGQEKRVRKDILLLGEHKFGAPDESVKTRLDTVTDLDRLDRMFRRALKASNWQEVLDTP
jgi:hypothetical protein